MATDAKAVLDELKAYLKEQGTTYGELAEKCQMPVVTIKRLMNREQVKFDQLQQLCEQAGTSLIAIMQRAEARQHTGSKLLPHEIAEHIYQQPQLYMVAKAILCGQRTIEELTEHFKVKPSTAYSYARQLEKLGICTIKGDNLAPVLPVPAMIEPQIHKGVYDMLVGKQLRYTQQVMAHPSAYPNHDFTSTMLLLTPKEFQHLRSQLRELMQSAQQQSNYNIRYPKSDVRERLLNLHISPEPAPDITKVQDPD